VALELALRHEQQRGYGLHGDPQGGGDDHVLVACAPQPESDAVGRRHRIDPPLPLAARHVHTPTRRDRGHLSSRLLVPGQDDPRDGGRYRSRSAREMMPSLAKTWYRWDSTVRTETTSRCAISALLIPAAASAATSCSRRLRPMTGSCGTSVWSIPPSICRARICARPVMRRAP